MVSGNPVVVGLLAAIAAPAEVSEQRIQDTHKSNEIVGVPDVADVG